MLHTGDTILETGDDMQTITSGTRFQPLPDEQVRRQIRGVSPVLEVPFTVGGEVDLPGFRRVVRYVIDTGVSSVMFPGFAGEYYKLSDSEREDLIEALLQEAHSASAPGGSPSERIAVILAVQDHATILAVQHARRLVDRGVDAINLLPPHLLSPTAPEVLAHVRAVLAAIPDTPVVLQYAPIETGTQLQHQALAELAVDHPNLAVVKVESNPPGEFITALSQLDPPLPALEGYAGVHLPNAFRRGAIGTQPGCSFTEIYQRIWELLVAGDLAAADRLHARLMPYITYWMTSQERIIAIEKIISVRRGLFDDPGCRRPCHVPDPAELEMIDRFLAEFDDLLPALA